jgi:hypothetical protein
MGTMTPELREFCDQIFEVFREAIERLDAADIDNDPEEYH